MFPPRGRRLGEARARLPVLSPGLSLDPKPKVARPKTKINFTSALAHSYPAHEAKQNLVVNSGCGGARPRG